MLYPYFVMVWGGFFASLYMMIRMVFVSCACSLLFDGYGREGEGRGGEGRGQG